MSVFFKKRITTFYAYIITDSIIKCLLQMYWPHYQSFSSFFGKKRWNMEALYISEKDIYDQDSHTPLRYESILEFKPNKQKQKWWHSPGMRTFQMKKCCFNLNFHTVYIDLFLIFKMIISLKFLVSLPLSSLPWHLPTYWDLFNSTFPLVIKDKLWCSEASAMLPSMCQIPCLSPT